MVTAFISGIPLGKVKYRNHYTPTAWTLRHHHNRPKKADLELLLWAGKKAHLGRCLACHAVAQV